MNLTIHRESFSAVADIVIKMTVIIIVIIIIVKMTDQPNSQKNTLFCDRFLKIYPVSQKIVNFMKIQKELEKFTEFLQVLHAIISRCYTTIN